MNPLNPESTTKFGCDVKMRSTQNKEFSKTCVASFMIWWSPYCEVANSIFLPFVVVLSFTYQFLDFILKSPSTAIKCELDSARVSRVSSKLSVVFSKPSLAFKAITRILIKRNKFKYFWAKLSFKTYTFL